MILTRNLYNKSNVEYSLFLSLLKRDSKEALFWGYEMYFSGFKRELIIKLWEYYYLLYAAFHVNLEKFLQKKTKEWLENQTNNLIVGTIIVNLSTREPCIDFYYMYNKELAYPDVIEKEIKTINNDEIKVLEDFVIKYNCYKEKGKNLMEITKETFENIKLLKKDIKKMAIISRMFSGLFLLDNENRCDKKLYINLTKDDIREYLTKPFVEDNCWKLPEMECKYQLCLRPNEKEFEINQYDNWLDKTIKCPIWEKRIKKYQGYYSEEKDKIVFENEDNEQEFYNWYNFEPDEQKKEVYEKWLGYKPFNTYQDIYDKYSQDILHFWIKTRLNNLLNNLEKK